MTRKRRVMLAAGGTGGHFYPGYVLGQALKEAGFEPLYLVREADPAGAVLDKDGLPFVEVPLRGMPRTLGPELVRFAWRLASGMRLVRRVVADFKPDAVVGMGGYLTFPAAWAAGMRGVPVLLHESNSVLGLANRASLPFSRALALGLPPARPTKREAELTGTPVRRTLWKLPEPAEARTALGLAPGLPTLLVFGGSQGARGLNRLVPEALKMTWKGPGAPGPFQVIHLPGSKEAAAVRAAYEGSPFRVLVLDYLHEMERAYAAADLVVSRSGASTLAELAATSRAAVLVPYPSAAAGHQEANASVAARAGAAVVLAENGLTARTLADALSDLMPSAGPGGGARRARLLDMGRRWSHLGIPKPPECVSGLVETVSRLADEAKT